MVVISYDIPSDARRNRLATLLKRYGNRVQYSVFEAHLQGAQLSHLQSKVASLIDSNTDSVRFYTLGKDWESRVQTLGIGLVHHPESEVVI